MKSCKVKPVMVYIENAGGEFPLYLNLNVLFEIQEYLGYLNNLSKILIENEKEKILQIFIFMLNEGIEIQKEFFKQNHKFFNLKDFQQINESELGQIKEIIFFMVEQNLFSFDDQEILDDEPKTQSEKSKINFNFILFAGVSLLGFSENEVWRMTLNKFNLLMDQFNIYKGYKKIKKEDKISNLDEINKLLSI